MTLSTICWNNILLRKGASEMAQQKVRLGTIVKIYRDPETEKQLEGHAFVWHIEKETEHFYTLMVSFLGDREERKVLRNLKKG